MPPKRPASAAFKAQKPSNTATSKGKAPVSRPNQSKSGKSIDRQLKTGLGSKKARAASPSESLSEDDSEDQDDEMDDDDDSSDLASEASEDGAAESSRLDTNSDSDSEIEMVKPAKQVRRKAPSTSKSKTAGPSVRNKQAGVDGRKAVRTVSHASSPRAENPQADAAPILPDKLLTALLYSHFQQPDTKIGRDARGLAGKYIETFIGEAVARAVVERTGGATGASKTGGGAGDFLEVEDLEKLAPQLILDF